MPNLHSRFQESPEACFNEIERALDELNQAVRGAVQRLESVAGLYEQYLKTRLPAGPLPPMTNWVYDVRMTAPYFDAVYPPEVYPEFAKRWVNKIGVLTTRLAMPRRQQYRFEIQIRDFASKEIEDSFQLHVDDAVCPWLDRTDRLFSTVIPENSAAESLEFRLSADPKACVHDVSFSFSTINITAI